MKINWGKTGAMVVKRGGGSCNVSVKGERIEEVKGMKYLGAMLNEEWSCEDEVDNRIGLTCRTTGTKEGGCRSKGAKYVDKAESEQCYYETYTTAWQ